MYLAQNNGLTRHFPSISLECPLNLPLIGHLVCVSIMTVECLVMKIVWFGFQVLF